MVYVSPRRDEGTPPYALYFFVYIIKSFFGSFFSKKEQKIPRKIICRNRRSFSEHGRWGR